MYFEEFESGTKIQIEPAVINKDDMICFAFKIKKFLEKILTLSL